MGNKTKRVALIGLLTCFIYIGRVTFTFLPNVQPMTTMLVLIVLTMGLKDGLTVALLSLVVSNLSMGFGVWTLAQLVSFTVILLAIAPLRRYYAKLPVVVVGVATALLGLLYGLVISLVQAPFFGWASFIPYYISGLPYDIYHAIGNFGFYMLLAPIMIPIINKRATWFK